jgi:hypothetical protein
MPKNHISVTLNAHDPCWEVRSGFFIGDFLTSNEKDET